MSPRGLPARNPQPAKGCHRRQAPGPLADAVVEQPDGAPDISHGLTPQLFGLLERLHRVVDVAVFLKAAARAGDMQQGHTQRVGDDVVHLTGDTPSFIGGGLLGELLLGLSLRDEQLLLRMRQPTNRSP